ncbi:hypothetical protein F4677DRAFT_443907 [Hypoxylon crocopeplum]|nr:hypothetical protein F4677DRAFT_443907 [Hypoxylon crocopeplum]
MARSFGLVVVALWLLNVAGVNGQQDNNPNRFTYPAVESLPFNYLDTIEVSYDSNITSPILYTFCRSENGDIQQERVDYPGSFNASAFVELNFTVDVEVAGCWFNIRLDEPNSAVGANSANFRYNSTEAERKTFSLDSPTSSTSGTSTSTPASTAGPTQSGVDTNPAAESTSATIPSPSPSPSPSASASPSPGLSTGAQAGIGVAAGLAGVAIGAVAVVLVLRRRKKRGGDGPKDVASSGSSHYPPTAGASDMTSSSQDPRLSYYAQVPSSEMQHGSKSGSMLVSHTPAIDTDGQKYGGALPVPGARHEMDGTPAPYEMP